MRRTSIYKILVGVIMLIAVLTLIPKDSAYASSVSAAFDVISNRDDIQVEDMIKVELNLTADEEIGAIEAYISYDSDSLEYIAGPDCILGGEGVLRISDPGTSTYSSDRTYLLYFKALSTGKLKLSLRKNPEIYDANEGDLMSVSAEPITFEVTSGESVSSDATLESIKVGSGTLEPSFDSSIKDYTVKVAAEVEKLTISAVPTDDMATVSIDGNESLKAGQNRITINVTAADGTENKYVLYAIKEESEIADDTKTEDSEKSEDKSSDTQKEQSADSGVHKQAFYVEERDSKVVLIADTEYFVPDNAASVVVPDGFVQTSVLISGYTLTAFAPEDAQVAEYLILVLQKEGSEPGLYCYDRIEKTIQRYDVTKGASISGEKALTAEEAQQLTDGYEKSLNNLTLVIAILCAVAMILLIITIKLILKLRR